MVFNVYLVRHGQTYLNRYNRMQGWCDSPLTPKGIKDGHKAGQLLSHINFDLAFHSDTTRATHTCRYILEENVASPSLPTPKALANFREQYYGYFEGSDSNQAWLMIGAANDCRTFKDIIEKYSIEDAKDFAKQADPFHDAENNQEYWQRVGAGFDYLKKIAKPDTNILLVSHGTTIRSIVHRFDPSIDITVSPTNGSVTKLIIDEQKIKVAYFNQTDPKFEY